MQETLKEQLHVVLETLSEVVVNSTFTEQETLDTFETMYFAYFNRKKDVHADCSGPTVIFTIY